MEWRRFVTYLWNDPRTFFCSLFIMCCHYWYKLLLCSFM